MMEIGAAISSAKAVAAFAQQSGKLEITQQVIELQQTLLALIGQNTELTAEVASLKQELREREASQQQAEEFVFDRQCYWRVIEGGTDGPYCSRCFDADDKAVRMHANNDGVVGCPACKTRVRVEPSTRPPSGAPRRVLRSNWISGWKNEL